MRGGAEHIILTDERLDESNVAVPMILAAGGVHTHLVKQKLRTFCSVNVRSAECLDVQYMAVLVGVGATTINAYLAEETIYDRHRRGLFGDLTVDEAVSNFKHAADLGLLKVLSKMGISVISSYRGAYNFEAVGLSRSLVAEFFPGMSSRVSGIGLAGIERKTIRQHERGFQGGASILPIGGFYRYRAKGEAHGHDGRLIHMLQTAVASDSYTLYKKYAEGVRALPPIHLRDLLDFKTNRKPVPVDEVESITSIRKRFETPAMSLGALSAEAHETLTIAMNRIGAHSNSGEGGESRDRFQPRPNGDNANSGTKQVASGRFGVTTEYLNNCREIQIKVAQGAKPGEGGQLPGFKVTVEIAKLRHSTPGVMLISPPAAPRHLFDRRSGAVDLRPEAGQSRCRGLGEAGRPLGHRHHRGRRRQGQCRRDRDLGPQWRHRRQPADLDQVRRRTLGDGAVRSQPGADAQPSAPSGAAAYRRRPEDRP